MDHFKNILEGVYRHPLTKNAPLQAFLRYFKWEIQSRLQPNKKFQKPFIEGLKLIMKRSLDGATSNLIFGLIEFEDMAFICHFLRPKDLFVDIGSNIGSFSLLASGVAGAKSLAIEPIPHTYNLLLENINLNQLTDKIDAKNLGVGVEPGRLNFTLNLDGINHVVTHKDKALDSIGVKVLPLDNLVEDKCPSVIKIDIEGYEYYALQGAHKTLSNTKLKAIIIELNGSCEHYGIDEQFINNMLNDCGFAAYDYDPKLRMLSARKDFKPHGSGKIYADDGTYNTLYLRDIDFVSQRIKNGSQISVFDKIF